MCGDWLELKAKCQLDFYWYFLLVVIFIEFFLLVVIHIEFFCPHVQISLSCPVLNWQLWLPQMTINWSKVCLLNTYLKDFNCKSKTHPSKDLYVVVVVAVPDQVFGFDLDRKSETELANNTLLPPICHFFKPRYSFIVIFLLSSTWWHQVAKTCALYSNWFQIYKHSPQTFLHIYYMFSIIIIIKTFPQHR